MSGKIGQQPPDEMILCGFPLQNAGRRAVGLGSQIWLANPLEHKPGRIHAHVVHIYLNGSYRWVSKHGKWIIVKGKQRNILRNLQSQPANVLQAMERKVVIAAQKDFWSVLSNQKIVQRCII